MIILLTTYLFTFLTILGEQPGITPIPNHDHPSSISPPSPLDICVSICRVTDLIFLGKGKLHDIYICTVHLDSTIQLGELVHELSNAPERFTNMGQR